MPAPTRRAPTPARRRPAPPARARARGRWRRAGAGRRRNGAGAPRARRGARPTSSISSRQRASTCPRGTMLWARSSSLSAWRTVSRGIERRVRVLEDHLDPPPLGALALGGHRLAGEQHLAGRRPVEADDAPAQRRLAAPRLADQPQRLAAGDLRGRRRRPPAACRAGRRVERTDQRRAHRELHLEAAHLEQRLSHRRSPAPPRPTAPAPRRGCTRCCAVGGDRPQRLVADRCSRAGRTRSADANRQPSGGMDEVGRRAGDRAQRPRARPPGRAPSAAGRACTDGGARGTPRRRVPVSTTCPAYITASRSQVWATTARSCVTKTTLTPSSSRSERSSFRI